MSMDLADFEDAVFGGGLPEAAQRLLQDAGRLRGSDPQAALHLLEQARTLAPQHPATLIALYRFHFYGHSLREARSVAERSLVLGAQTLGLNGHWRDTPPVPMGGARFDPTTRFFLFALKGYAYLSLRIGDTDVARPALTLLKALDPDDRVGGALLGEVLARAESGLDDDACEDAMCVDGGTVR